MNIKPICAGRDIPRTCSWRVGSANRNCAGLIFLSYEAWFVHVPGLIVVTPATVAEELGTVLKTPVRRLGAPRMPVPYAPPLEDEYRITEKHIAAAARGMLGR